ncbi:predicted protein [Nematostella vectensis]|uniref:folate gamma-glutamyl hydrolase n=2 Tax=Nematostella vectensis TaxID=45351 RepID=A7SS46_NEMVE|nr:gamma-glutamyl hydrolase isoform X2 [Nematostella vectensis]EDO33450.1 predicted protein [Nematostella vectensis]|eukprot:XP_001625550.1 predicted protein [Nematostella vectensis]
MVESAGARAAPIFVDRTPEEIEKMFHSVSGVVFPGGHIKLNASRYAAVGKQILELAIKENLKGEVFPVWAECLGLELISMIISGVSLNHGQYKNNLLHYTDARNLLLPLKLTPDFRQSKLFGTASQQLIDHIQSHPIAYNNHIKGISPKKFHRYKRLSNMFRIVSTNVDRQGSEFIATLEGREMPLFLFHWHPSKPMFEWSTEKVFSHSQEAIWLGQHVADVFINQARQSGHRFPTRREEARALIYNYPVTYTGVETTFMQAYFFQMTNRNASALP